MNKKLPDSSSNNVNSILNYLFRNGILEKFRKTEMPEIDKIKRVFDGELCNQLLVDLITIPCGSMICKKHIDLTRRPNQNSLFISELC